MIAHIVLFEPKPDLTTEARHVFLESLRHAVRSIPGVRQARIGKTLNVGLMPAAQVGGSTYSFAAVLEFDDQAALDFYYKHPAHDELRRLFWMSCQATVIADTSLAAIDSPESDLLV